MKKIFATAALSVLLAAGGAVAQSGGAGGAATTNPATNGATGTMSSDSKMKVDPGSTGSTTNPSTEDCKPGVGTKTESGVTTSKDNNTVAKCAN